MLSDRTESGSVSLRRRWGGCRCLHFAAGAALGTMLAWISRGGIALLTTWTGVPQPRVMLARVSPGGKIERIRQLVKGPEVELLGRLQFLERS